MKTTTIAALMSILALAGCRREDIREFTVEIPGLTRGNQAKVEAALRLKDGRPFDGLMPETYAFDFEKKTLTMKYDSMKTAHTNIRMLIADAGVEVAFPSNVTGRAGH